VNSTNNKPDTSAQHPTNEDEDIVWTAWKHVEIKDKELL